MMLVSNLVDLDTRRENIDDDGIVEGNNAGAELFAPDKFAGFWIAREEVAFDANERAFVAFHRTDEMPAGVVGKKLSMDDVNVFASINDHRFVEVAAVLSSRLHELKSFLSLGAQDEFVHFPGCGCDALVRWGSLCSPMKI
jgi:hypothetical protein